MTEVKRMPSRLPSNEIGHGEPGPAELAVEPQAEVVQAHFGRQSCPYPDQGMGTFPIQSTGVEQAVMGRLNDLSDAGQPVPPCLRPPSLTLALWCTVEAHAKRLLPEGMAALALEPGVGHVVAADGLPHFGNKRVLTRPRRQERLRPRLVLGRGGRDTEARDEAVAGDGGHDMQPLVPPQ